MRELGTYADRSLQALHDGDFLLFSSYFPKNFAMRRKIYGDPVVGERNIQVVSMAESFGLAAKFTGSGGAILCVRNDAAPTAGTFYTEMEEEPLRRAFDKEGFKFVRIAPAPAPQTVAYVGCEKISSEVICS